MECHTNTSTSEVNPVSGVHGATRIANNAHDSSWRVTDASAEGSATCETCHTSGALERAPERDAAGCADGGVRGERELHGRDGDVRAGRGALDVPRRRGRLVAPVVGERGAEHGGGVRQLPRRRGRGVHGGGAGWRGISASHSDAQITPNHDVCYYCHLYKNGDVTYYDITNATQHRDGNIEIGAQNDSGTDTHIGFRDNGATVGCVNCHLGERRGGQRAARVHGRDDDDALGHARPADDRPGVRLQQLPHGQLGEPHEHERERWRGTTCTRPRSTA